MSMEENVIGFINGKKTKKLSGLDWIQAIRPFNTPNDPWV